MSRFVSIHESATCAKGLSRRSKVQAQPGAARDEARIPAIRPIARANRAFLGRAVRLLAQAGIGQFVDIGSGIPAERNVHEVTQRADPAARVVYVDMDPVAITHSKAVLAGNDNAAESPATCRPTPVSSAAWPGWPPGLISRPATPNRR
jgi:hypothetical protein